MSIRERTGTLLAQSAPAATTLTDVYTVPTGTKARRVSITVANRSASNRTYRLSFAPGGAADATSQYIAYDVQVDKNSSQIIAPDGGFTLPAGCVVRVYASTTDLTFTVNGELEAEA